MKKKTTAKKFLSAVFVCMLFALLLALSADAQSGREICIGDVNADGIVSVEDARIVLRRVTGLDVNEEATEEETTEALPEETTAGDETEDNSAEKTDKETAESKTLKITTSDTNLNGKFTVADARYILRVSIGLSSYYTDYNENYSVSVSKNKGVGHTVSFVKNGTKYYTNEPCKFVTVSEDAPTCLEKGTSHLRCDICGKTATKKIPATGHNFSGTAIKTAKGKHCYKCLNGCGTKTEAETCSIVSSVKTPARCGVKGTTLYKCAYCSYSYTKTDIPALKHKFKNYKSDNNATWLKDGTKTAKCSNEGCKETKTVTDKGSKLDSSHIPSKVKVLYLTFDDGPSTYTDDILRILKQKGAKATWFVIHSSTYSSCYKQIVDEGHAIGLHSYTHNYSQIYRSTTAFYNDLQKISDEVYKYTGVRSKLYRFPGGSSNTVSRSYCYGIMSSLTKSIQQKGYAYFDWNAQNNDATGVYYSADGLYRAAISSCGKNRVVMLMHDCGDKYNTVASLGRIIDYYQARGYYCLALDEKSETAHHGVAN